MSSKVIFFPTTASWLKAIKGVYEQGGITLAKYAQCLRRSRGEKV